MFKCGDTENNNGIYLGSTTQRKEAVRLGCFFLSLTRSCAGIEPHGLLPFEHASRFAKVCYDALKARSENA